MQINYDYWQTRCEVEQTDTAIKARKYVYEADKLFSQAIIEDYLAHPDDEELSPGAQRLYEMAWDEWAKIFDEYPMLMEDVTAENLLESIVRYRQLLGQTNEDLPEDFKLAELVEMYGGPSQSTDE